MNTRLKNTFLLILGTLLISSVSGCSTANKRTVPTWDMPKPPKAHRGKCPELTTDELKYCSDQKNANKELCHRAVRCKQLEDYVDQLEKEWPMSKIPAQPAES